MRDLVVVGGGGHARVVVSTVRKLGSYRIVGYTDPQDRGRLLGVGYLGTDEVLGELAGARPGLSAALGVGCAKSDPRRGRILERLAGLGLELPALVSPRAVVNEDVAIGRATVVCDGAVIQPGARIGAGVIVNTNSTVEHDCVLEDGVHLASGATLGGGVRIGSHSLIGAGATVVQARTICSGCTIGAGAAVVRDCVRPGVYVGVPARLKA